MPLVVGLALTLRLLIAFFSASHPDLGNHLDWGNKFWQYGPRNFYTESVWNVSWPNQPIGSIYLFAFLAKINQSVLGFIWHLNTSIPLFPSKLVPLLEEHLHPWLVKLPFIISDVLIGLIIYLAIRKKNLKAAPLLACLYLFNLPVIYNSAIWGQTDSLINLLSLSGLLLLLNKRYFWGILIFLSSYLFKVSLIIYLPVFLIILFVYRRDWSKWLLPSLFFLVFLILITIPFSGFNNPISWLIHLYRDLVFNRQGQMLSGNAFNLWGLFFGTDLTLKNSLLVFGIPASHLGQLLFITFSIPALMVFINRKLSLANLVHLLFIISFSAFILLTNMHERYLYPIFPLLPILYLYRKLSLTTVIILTFIHFINLYNLWFYPNIPALRSVLEYSDFLLPRLFSLLLIGIYLKFYIKYLKRE